MATPGINTKIKLDGEAEYRAALSSIDKSFRELGSEMNLLSAKFSENGDSMEALSAKSEVLSKKVDTQQKRVDTLKKAVAEAQSIQEKAQKTFDETSSTLDAGSKEYKDMSEQVQKAADQTAVWQTKLNNAEAELYKMKDALEENNAELDKAGASGSKFQQAMDKIKDSVAKAKEEGTGAKGVFANLKESFADGKGEAVGLGDALGSLIEKLGINLPEGADKALNALNGINAGNVKAVAGFAAVAAAIVKCEKSLISVTKEAGAYSKEVRRLASITGQSREDVIAFTYAAEKMDVSYDRISDSLKEITNKMQEAQNGSEDTAAAFNRLGISIEDSEGNLRSSMDVFLDTIDALGNIKNQADRDALAMDLMSEEARELNPIIEKGSQELEGYARAAKNTGKVLTEDALIALEAVDDQVQRLQTSQESLKNQMASEFAPYLEEFYGRATNLTDGLGSAIKSSGIVDAFGMMLDTFTNLLPTTNELADDAVPKLTQTLRPVARLLAAIADSASVAVGFAQVLFSWGFSGKQAGYTRMANALGWNYNSGVKNNVQSLTEMWEQEDTNAMTRANGYGQYYGNGKWYGNYDSYLYDEWKKQEGAGSSFEAWKNAKGYNAAGTDNFIGGVTWVGENGPEPVWLPQGSRIGTNQEGRSLSGGDTYNFIVQANEIREIDSFIRRMKNQRRMARMGVT